MILEAARLHTWYTSPQGQTAARLIAHLMARWVCVGCADTMTLGLGFTQPYLDRMRCIQATNNLGGVLGASPAEMGVLSWPSGQCNRFAQARPDALPFADKTFDCVLMVHFLEGCDSPKATLREAWRVMSPGGRLVVMVPNRGGLWARRDTTPFGWGRPFSPRQLTGLLTESLFVLRQSRFALFVPPLNGKRFLQAAPAWEKAGNRWFAPLGGVILCEAEKVVYATTLIGKQPHPLHPQGLPFSRGFVSGFQHGDHTSPTRRCGSTVGTVGTVGGKVS